METRAVQEEVTPSSGNVFADLELDNPEELLAKARLVHAISQAVEAQELTQKEMAKVLGITQPQVSQLLRGYITGFSSDRLMQLLTRLDQDVEIIIRPRPSTEARPAHVTVAIARAL